MSPPAILSGTLSCREASVVSIGDEAELLALVFLGGAELILPCQFAYLCFGIFAEGHHRAAELLLCKRGEEIGLVLLRIQCFAQQRASCLRVPFDSRVMSCRDKVALQRIGKREEFAEFQFAVAYHARAWCPAGEVFFHEVVNNLFAEDILVVDTVERDAELRGDAARVLNAFKRTAVGTFGFNLDCIRRAEAHSDADDIVPRVYHHSGSDGAIHATAHRD